MRKSYLILIGIVLILLFIAVVGPINAAITGLIIGTVFLIFIIIFMLCGIVDYFEKTKFAIKFAWSPEPFVFSKKDLAKAIIILSLCIVALVILWTVVAHHPWLYPHLKSAGII